MLATMRVAVVQMTSTDDLGANLAAASAFVVEAAGAGAKLVGLPENFAYLRREGQAIPCAQDLDGEGGRRRRGRGRLRLGSARGDGGPDGDGDHDRDAEGEAPPAGAIGRLTDHGWAPLEDGPERQAPDPSTE